MSNKYVVLNNDGALVNISDAAPERIPDGYRAVCALPVDKPLLHGEDAVYSVYCLRLSDGEHWFYGWSYTMALVYMAEKGADSFVPVNEADSVLIYDLIENDSLPCRYTVKRITPLTRRVLSRVTEVNAELCALVIGYADECSTQRELCRLECAMRDLGEYVGIDGMTGEDIRLSTYNIWRDICVLDSAPSAYLSLRDRLQGEREPLSVFLCSALLAYYGHYDFIYPYTLYRMLVTGEIDAPLSTLIARIGI